MLNLRKLDASESLGPWTLLSSSLGHKELLCNRESNSSHLTSLCVCFSLSFNLLYTLSFSLPLPHLTSLLTSLTVSISLLLTKTTSTFLSPLMSFSFYLPYSLLPPHHIIVETERLYWSPRHGSSTGHLVSVLWVFLSVSFHLFHRLFLSSF